MITISRYIRVPVSDDLENDLHNVIVVVRMPTADEWGTYASNLAMVEKGQGFKLNIDFISSLFVRFEGTPVVTEDGSPAALWDFGMALISRVMKEVDSAVSGKRYCPAS